MQLVTCNSEARLSHSTISMLLLFLVSYREIELECSNLCSFCRWEYKADCSKKSGKESPFVPIFSRVLCIRWLFYSDVDNSEQTINLVYTINSQLSWTDCHESGLSRSTRTWFLPHLHIILLGLCPSRMVFKASPQSKTEQCYINLENLRVGWILTSSSSSSHMMLGSLQVLTQP